MTNLVNATTAVIRPGKATRYVFEGKDYAFLNELQRALAALHLDLANAGGQIALGIVPAQDGPRDKRLELGLTVEHEDGRAHSSTVQHYENFTDDGIAFVMAKVAHHMGPFKSVAKISRTKF